MNIATTRQNASNPLELPAEFLDELWPADSDDPAAETPDMAVAPAPRPTSATAFEVLDGALMLLRGLAARKRSKVFPAA
jgi:hypothetical protein